MINIEKLHEIVKAKKDYYWKRFNAAKTNEDRDIRRAQWAEYDLILYCLEDEKALNEFYTIWAGYFEE